MFDFNMYYTSLGGCTPLMDIFTFNRIVSVVLHFDGQRYIYGLDGNILAFDRIMLGFQLYFPLIDGCMPLMDIMAFNRIMLGFQLYYALIDGYMPLMDIMAFDRIMLGFQLHYPLIDGYMLLMDMLAFDRIVSGFLLYCPLTASFNVSAVEIKQCLFNMSLYRLYTSLVFTNCLIFSGVDRSDKRLI